MDKEEKVRKDLMKQNLIETELAHSGPIDPIYQSDAFNYYQRIITPQGIPKYLREMFFGPLNEVLNYGFLDKTDIEVLEIEKDALIEMARWGIPKSKYTLERHIELRNASFMFKPMAKRSEDGKERRTQQTQIKMIETGGVSDFGSSKKGFWSKIFGGR